MKFLCLFLYMLISFEGALNIEYSFVIISQNNDYNTEVANRLKAEMCGSISEEEYPLVYLSHIDFPHVGDWTIIPILKDIHDVIGNVSWLIILEERTRIRLEALKRTLEKYDYTKELWIGHALEDDNPTIIHHFNDLELKYPHMGAGVAITIPLVKRLSSKIASASKTTDFSIDKSFELALFIWNEGNKTSLIHDDAFCVKENDSCATYLKNFEACQSPVFIGSIHFAVKTCRKFHYERVPVVLNTWAKYTKNLKFFSDLEDSSIPTISLGVPNTESGHCGKTLSILNHYNERIKEDGTFKWLVIADDDTILSVQRITELLSCYNSDDDIALGERYGYGVYNSLGFNYITGGGGMIFSRSLLKKLANTCRCPSISSPDDMILGQCLANLGVAITHSSLFHQARPMDYPNKLLESDRHISFHKHWMLDPIAVYKEWFEKQDLKLSESHDTKDEL